MAKRIAAKQVPEHSEGEGAGPSKASAMQDAIYALFPTGQGRGAPTYVAQDVFGYSFLADVFMADFKDGSVSWQGFLRPYASADEAKAIFEKYVASAKQNGGDPKLDRGRRGRPDVPQRQHRAGRRAVFRKGNVIGGANGAADTSNNEANARSKAEAFARAFVKSLPADLPKGAPAEGTKPEKAAEGEAG